MSSHKGARLSRKPYAALAAKLKLRTFFGRPPAIASIFYLVYRLARKGQWYTILIRYIFLLFREAHLEHGDKSARA